MDLKRFEGALPYASELLGVYQPLLGWKSRLTEGRFGSSEESLFRGLSQHALSRFRSDVTVQVSPGSIMVDPLQLVEGSYAAYASRVAIEIESIIALTVALGLPLDRMPDAAEWTAIVSRDRLSRELYRVRDYVELLFMRPVLDGIHPSIVTYMRKTVAAIRRRDRDPSVEQMAKELIDREISIASYLEWLSVRRPDVLSTLFYRNTSDPLADIANYVRDPLDSFGHNSLEAVLSPIGLVHLFRQYFFEFDTFLGPPVGHIWLSPGSTLELVEESSRRTLTERTVETLADILDRTEKSDLVHDELSSAIREENRTNIKFGFGADVNYDNGTTEVGAHTDFSLENSRTSARETAHKQMREQSQKVTAEIRKSFKSTFKTVTETTASSSRRYVLQNTTDELINYELRRKMRQVGVQVQDIGTQLCWQVFVDDPGRDLGLGKLLHIAEPPDLAGLHAPAQPARLEPKTVELDIQFPYMRAEDSGGQSQTNALYIEGDDGEQLGGGSRGYGYNDKIIHIKRYTLTVPASGYTLTDQFSNVRSEHTGTLQAEVKLVTASPPEIEVILHQVNFMDQPHVRLRFDTVWLPSPSQQQALDSAYSLELASYNSQKSALERTAYLAAAKERIKLASQLRKRPFDDLREEERTMVYRALLVQLMRAGQSQKQDEHITSELIRAIFDVDKMLYFVAPEWWRVRAYDARHQLAVTAHPEVLSGDSIVGWEGPKATGRPNNYLITEESDPAPAGSSLGWLLQLDGDALRNAFLNSPWVKAIVPIRPGKEEAAINWLTLANVAGATGLDGAYDAPAEELQKIADGLAGIGRTAHDPVTLYDALIHLSHRIGVEYKAATTARPSPFDPEKNVIPTETVFEHGFYPLQGSFEVNTDPARVFSQWVEVLATDQVAAVPYDAAEHL
jgi:hypothetical protein